MVLRLSERASPWLTAARTAPDAPDSVQALLRGRRRIEVTVDEAAHALVWACAVDGWSDDDAPPPIRAYRLGDLHPDLAGHDIST